MVNWRWLIFGEATQSAQHGRRGVWHCHESLKSSPRDTQSGYFFWDFFASYIQSVHAQAIVDEYLESVYTDRKRGERLLR